MAKTFDSSIPAASPFEYATEDPAHPANPPLDGPLPEEQALRDMLVFFFGSGFVEDIIEYIKLLLDALDQPNLAAGTQTVTEVDWVDAAGHTLASLSGLNVPLSTFLANEHPGTLDYTGIYKYWVSLLDGDITEHFTGTGGSSDIEVGAGGTASVTSGAGADTVYVWHQKNIILDTAGGNDTLRFEVLRGTTPGPASGATVDLTAHTGVNPYGGSLAIHNVENVVGTNKDDILRGDALANTLDGSLGGNDTIEGEGGDDKAIFKTGLSGAHQTIVADGGTGTDSFNFDFSFAPNTVSILDLASPSNDTGVFAGATVTNFEIFSLGDFSFPFADPHGAVDFRGTSAGETVSGGWGDDIIKGNGGNDALTGLDGNDTLLGGAGSDTLDSSVKTNFTSVTAGADFLDGGTDIDLAIITRFGTSQALSLDLTDPAVLHAMEDGTRLIRVERLDFGGGSGNDSIAAGALQDKLDGGGGDDRLDGGGGADTVKGSSGADTLIGGLGNDDLDGGTNPEVGQPGAQGDVMLGGDGNDTYHVNSGLDLVDEGSYFSEIGFGGTDTIISTTDFYWDIASVGEIDQVAENVVDPGGDGVTIVGGVFDNTLIGHKGTDVLFGRGGSDVYRAGDGVDFISLSTLGVTDTSNYTADGHNTIIVDPRASGPFSYDIVFEFDSAKDKSMSRTTPARTTTPPPRRC